MTRTSEISRIAATVWDQDEHSKADLLFLEEIALADRWCSKQLSQSNILFGATSTQHQQTKNAIAVIRQERYVAALSRLQVAEDADILSFAEAAE
jgi:hypothetical protein